MVRRDWGLPRWGSLDVGRRFHSGQWDPRRPHSGTSGTDGEQVDRDFSDMTLLLDRAGDEIAEEVPDASQMFE